MSTIATIATFIGENGIITATNAHSAVSIILAQHLQAQSAYGLRLIIPLIGKKFKRLTVGGEVTE